MQKTADNPFLERNVTRAPSGKEFNNDERRNFIYFYRLTVLTYVFYPRRLRFDPHITHSFEKCASDINRVAKPFNNEERRNFIYFYRLTVLTYVFYPR